MLPSLKCILTLNVEYYVQTISAIIILGHTGIRSTVSEILCLFNLQLAARRYFAATISNNIDVILTDCNSIIICTVSHIDSFSIFVPCNYRSWECRRSTKQVFLRWHFHKRLTSVGLKFWTCWICKREQNLSSDCLATPRTIIEMLFYQL